jgi:L-aminopeptidase/D-esterase-like protein
VRTTTRRVTFVAGVGCASLLARAMVGNAAGIVAAVLSDFEARRTEVPPLRNVEARRTSRATSAKLPTRLKADIDLARSAAPKRTIDLTSASEPISR